MNEPRYDADRAEFVCADCDRPALMQHPDDDHRLVCMVCGARFVNPADSPWPTVEAASR